MGDFGRGRMIARDGNTVLDDRMLLARVAGPH
jgi:hypothetical protein